MCVGVGTEGAWGHFHMVPVTGPSAQAPLAGWLCPLWKKEPSGWVWAQGVCESSPRTGSAGRETCVLSPGQQTRIPPCVPCLGPPSCLPGPTGPQPCSSSLCPPPTELLSCWARLGPGQTPITALITGVCVFALVEFKCDG